MNPTGFCGCGCGQMTPLASKTINSRGWRKGEHIDFINNHHSRRPLEDRLWPKVEKTADCWYWLGGRMLSGYGAISVDCRNRAAHRVVYELLVGKVPDGLELDHLCRVRLCVNPAHLEPVTHRENVLRGISPMAANAKKTHCYRGHAYDDENTHLNTKGGRKCRTCQRLFRKGAKRPGIGEPGDRTHCPKGHAYDEQNTRIDTKGGRNCRECGRIRGRLRWAADRVPADTDLDWDGA